MKSSPTVVVLAAGFGRRFDAIEQKLRQPLGRASVLGSTLLQVIESQLPVVVVTTPQMASHASEWVAARDVLELAPKDLGEGFGIGRSIARGVQARGQSPGWLVLPGDMPLVRPDTLRAVAAALDEHPVTYAQHRGQRGHPVAFSCELYSELSQLTGDEGARRVVFRYPSRAVDVDDPGVLMDIDTADDLHLARAYHAADQAALAVHRGPV